jgi:putative endonuclease
MDIDRWERAYYVYIITNKNNTVLYTGVTNYLQRRIYEHKHDLHKGFSQKYRLHKLVYYEVTDDVIAAIAREKQIKKGPRRRKIDLIESMNPAWRDLYLNISE